MDGLSFLTPSIYNSSWERTTNEEAQLEEAEEDADMEVDVAVAVEVAEVVEEVERDISTIIETGMCLFDPTDCLDNRPLDS
jgi:hypothetical protein